MNFVIGFRLEFAVNFSQTSSSAEYHAGVLLEENNVWRVVESNPFRLTIWFSLDASAFVRDIDSSLWMD